MEIRCIAIDDEPLALELIKEYVSKFPALKLIQTFDDAISGAEFLRNVLVDLLFIDINMPDITGIDLIRSLKEKPIIIFITAHKKFAIDGFDLDALDYLLKPIPFERFARMVNKAIEYHQHKQNSKEDLKHSLFVRSEYRMVKIDLSAIEYIESLEDYIKIHLGPGKFVLTLMTLKTILEKLPPDRFKRIHRSYIVPVARVSSVLNRRVQLNTSKELPISDSYADFVENWMKQEGLP